MSKVKVSLTDRSPSVTGIVKTYWPTSTNPKEVAMITRGGWVAPTVKMPPGACWAEVLPLKV